MDRNLTSPVNRGAMITGSLAYQAVTTIIQSLIVFAVGFLAGARYTGGIPAILLVVGLATLIARVRRPLGRDRPAGASAGGADRRLPVPVASPDVRVVGHDRADAHARVGGAAAKFNPVDWAAVASREAMSSTPDWGVLASRGGALAALALVMGWLASRAFRSYQRSV